MGRVPLDSTVVHAAAVPYDEKGLVLQLGYTKTATPNQLERLNLYFDKQFARDFAVQVARMLTAKSTEEAWNEIVESVSAEPDSFDDEIENRPGK